MKKIFLSLILLSSISSMLAQSTGIKYATNQNNLIVEIAKDKNSNYLVIMNSNDISNSYSKVFTMNHNCKFLDSITLRKDSFGFYSISRLIPLNNGYIGLGSIKLKSNTNEFLLISRFNKQFNLIQDTLVPLKMINLPSIAIDKDSNVIFAVNDYSSNNYYGKINTKGELKLLKADSTNLGISNNSIIIRKDSLLYSIFYDYKFITFDTIFNKIHESKTLFNRTSLGFNTTVTPVSDSIVCMASKANTTNGLRHFFGVTSLSGIEIYKNIYSTSVDTAIWGAWNKNTDTTKSGEWFWGGTYNFILSSSLTIPASSYFILHKLNKNYTTKWTKKYGGDAYYTLVGVLATDDGGCLMYGTRYDYNNVPKYDAYILKVNGEGIVTGESTVPLSLNTVSIYPNPSNGFVNFDYEEPLTDVQISILDVTGKLVHQIKPSDGVLPALDLSFLNNGAYFIHIMVQNRPFSVTRWIKHQ